MEEHSGEVEEVKERLETARDSIRNEQKEKTKAVEKRVAAVKVHRKCDLRTSQMM